MVIKLVIEMQNNNDNNSKRNGLGDSIPMMDIGSQLNCYCISGDSYN
jgi:hypothetical protein